MVSKISNFIENTLAYLGIIEHKASLLLIGPDNAGKSTLLKVLLNGKPFTIAPTILKVSEEVEFNGKTLEIFELSVCEPFRKRWNGYLDKVDGIVFVIDAADSERFEEAKAELEQVLSCPAFKKLLILVLGNKIDRDSSVDEEELKAKIGFEAIAEDKSRPFNLFMCSFYKQVRINEALNWLTEELFTSK